MPCSTPTFVRHLAVAAFAAAALPAAARSAAFDIPAQPLAEAMQRFARQSGLQIGFAPELLAGRRSQAVQGLLPPETALRQLLLGSGLQAWRDGATWTLERVPDAAATTLREVVVRADAEREQAGGPVRGYAARRSATGSKTDTALLETPQSLSIVTAEEMAVTRPQSLTDALAYTAGVFRSEGNDRTADRLYIRGFYADAIEGSMYRDGLKSQVNAFNGRTEPYGLERIEVLKGAASVLYGSAAPGGVINAVTKRPSAQTLREVNLEAGSHQRRQLAADLGGALAPDSDWSWRLTLLHRDSDTFVDFVSDDRTYIAPALRWQPSADTSLTLLSHWQKSRTKYVFGFPARGTVLPNPNGQIPVRRYLGEPDRDHNLSTQKSLGYLFEHAFSADLRLRHNLNLFRAEVSMPATWPLSGDFDDDAQRTVPRFAESRREDASSALAADVSLEYRWQLAGTENTVLGGLDQTRQKHQSERWLAWPAALDVYAPVYGLPLDGPATPRPYRASRKERHVLTGLYLQNQTRIDGRWTLLLGGRQDWARDRESPFFGPQDWAQERSKAFSGRAGLVYQTDAGVAPFASWSQSFQPQPGSDRQGKRFAPTRGEQVEAGVRWQPPSSRTLLSAVVYQLTRQNVTTTDPTDSAFSVQTGEVRSRGLELEAKVQPTRRSGVLAAYAYTDARTTRSNDASAIGKRTGAVPRHQLSLWADHRFDALGLPGLKAGLGLRHVGSTTATYISDVRVPAFTLLDAMLAYEAGAWRVALNVSNLTDRVHVTNCIDVCYYGEPRNALLSLKYSY